MKNVLKIKPKDNPEKEIVEPKYVEDKATKQYLDYINDHGNVMRHNGKDYYNTGINLKGPRGAVGPRGLPGKDGLTPHIGENGNWFIGGKDTLVKAKGSGEIKKITYSQLKSLRGDSNLSPGCYYRITDYQCTTTQEGTQSAGHQFDIVLLALSKNKLAEEGWAMMNESDVYTVTFSDGVIKKCWIYQDDYYDNIVDYTTLLGNDSMTIGEEEDNDIILDKANRTAICTSQSTVLHDSDLIYNYFQNANLSAWELKYCLDNDTHRFIWADPTNGKGVIYYMKDEWDNIAPFDFKNMLFTRNTEWFGDHETWAENVLGDIPDTDLHFYFLSWVTEDSEIQDASIVGQTLQNDERAYSGVYGNKIKETSAYEMGITEDVTSFTFALPCTIIVSSYFYEGGTFYGCFRNTFGNNCCTNTFGNGCSSNTFGEGCYSNTFGNNCYTITFWNNCFDNTFKNDCFRIRFGNNCYDNTFGEGCYSNTFGNECFDNTFGDSCISNTFGNNCSTNTFGNNCSSNTFGEYCVGNTFGNGVQSPQSYFYNIIFENGNININLTCSKTTSSSNRCRNVLVSLGVNNSGNRKTITITEVNQTHKTIVKTANDVEITA